MSLAVMLSVDKDAFVCDMAETYHILDYRALPVDLLAVLASGLRDDSRIKMKIAGVNYIPAVMVLPQIADRLMDIIKLLNGDKKKKIKYMSDLLFETPDKKRPVKAFRSGAEFNKAWERLTGGEKNG